MAITYHAGRRIQGLDTEGFSSGTMSATGGTVTTNTSVTPNRKIHTFTSSGNFVVTGTNTDIQYLVIGGGGGGTANGGGGAGAYRESGVSSGDSAITLTAGTYAITVGAGGSGNDSGSPSGNNDGSSSIFSTITSEGGGSGGQQGGGAGGSCTIGGSNNGSGGGGGGENTAGACAGGASGAYGNAGGSGVAVSPAGAGGGGGGAGSAGTNAGSSMQGGNGGNGLASSITGSSVTRAGGGGGGTWLTNSEGSAGSGGAGGGLNRTGGSGTHATVNTGSGGGGKWDSGSAGNGGSGIVIISYVDNQSYSVNNLPNAQLGSRYEATDTRKMYNYKNNGTSELKAYYNMEQTSGNLINQQTTGDGLGSNADGTNTNVTQNSTGKVGTYSYSYNGTTSSSKTLLGSSTSQFNFLHADQATISVNIWYKKTSVDTNFRTIIASTAAGAQNGFRMAFSGTNSLRVEIYNNGNNLVNSPHSSSSAIIPSNTDWHMLTVTVDRTLSSDNLIVYIDGSSVYTADKTSNSGTSSNAQYAMAIGDDQGGDGNMYGNFDELSIWNKVLTSDEITTLYNSGSGQVITDDMSTIWKEIGT
jgi:hypothetical protein